MLLESLPDTMKESNQGYASALQWVGMEAIAMPIVLPDNGNETAKLTASCDVFVSLDNPDAKGIHMSRLYGLINQLNAFELNQHHVENLLNDIITSQQGNSDNAKLVVRFSWVFNKKSLLSGGSGFQAYDIVVNSELTANGCNTVMSIDIPYSSTCPCSASLSRQLLGQRVDDVFSEDMVSKEAIVAWLQSQEGSVATPHSQRSFAYLNLDIGGHEWPALTPLILMVEECLSTPLQTAVKRQDEQEFARLNATHLMFCEDAARRIKLLLETMPKVKNYWFKVEHKESVHAHNAVVIDKK